MCIRDRVYPDPKRLGAQLKYADAHGFTVALVAGGNEWNESRMQVKTLATQEKQDVTYTHDSPQELAAAIKKILE